MIAHVKARYTNGALVPLEPLELEEGKEVMVSVEETLDAEANPLQKSTHELQRPASQGISGVGPTDAEKNSECGPNAQKEGPLLRILRFVQARQAELPPDTWDDLPTDLVRNKKHYLYGHPKEDN